jgi:hypothetical protein
MSEVNQADTPRIRDAPPTRTITGEDVRTMMLSRIQVAQAREGAAQAIAHAENMPVEDARRQVQQYEQQYRQAIDQAKQQATQARRFGAVEPALPPDIRRHANTR